MVDATFKTIIFFLIFLISGCDDKGSIYRKKIFSIGGRTVVVPDDWEYWIFWEMSKSENPYDQILFSFDVNTFRTIERDAKNENQLDVELRPVNSELGEKEYWTNKDRINDLKVIKCENIKIHGEMYEHCYHIDSKEQVASFVETDIQSIKNKKTGKYVSVFGCAGDLPPRMHMNRICVGRSRISDTLQVEYSYRFSHFNRAVDIDLKIRNVMLGLLK